MKATNGRAISAKGYKPLPAASMGAVGVLLVGRMVVLAFRRTLLEEQLLSTPTILSVPRGSAAAESS